MVVYCPPIEKVSCLFHLVCTLHTQNILLDDILHLRPVVPGDDTYTTYTKHTIGRYSTFTSRRPRRRYIHQCTYYSFLVNLLQQKEPPVPGTHTCHETIHDPVV